MIKDPDRWVDIKTIFPLHRRKNIINHCVMVMREVQKPFIMCNVFAIIDKFSKETYKSLFN